MENYLSRLEERLSSLQESLRQSSLEDAKRELKKCEATFGLIQDLLQRQGGDLTPYFEQFQRVLEAVVDISSDIEALENVWWRKAWSWLREKAFSLLGPFATLIGKSDDLKRLE